MNFSVVEDTLKRTLQVGGYPYGIAATSDGTVVASVGSPGELETDDLRRMLFGDADAIARLSSSLEGQLLPRIWSQGSVRCAVYRPTARLVIGIFSQKKAGAVEMYREFAALKPQLQEGVQ